mmetsp:Transcript_64324/g.112182  ORF Transcript_64324/g.112182 Transcript_64324/m.112182 type:complete len:202 (+) Transcript_64324:2045-2650(+)
MVFPTHREPVHQDKTRAVVAALEARQAVVMHPVAIRSWDRQRQQQEDAWRVEAACPVEDARQAASPIVLPVSEQTTERLAAVRAWEVQHGDHGQHHVPRMKAVVPLLLVLVEQPQVVLGMRPHRNLHAPPPVEVSRTCHHLPHRGPHHQHALQRLQPCQGLVRQQLLLSLEVPFDLRSELASDGAAAAPEVGEELRRASLA